MSADKGAPVILRYENEAEREEFLAAFAKSFHIISCCKDQQAIAAIINHPGNPPALVLCSSRPDSACRSELLHKASGAGCFRILISGQVSLDDIIQLLDDQVIDRCYGQPWEPDRLRSDLFLATMSVEERRWPTPTGSDSSQPLVLIVDDETTATKYLSRQLLRLQDRFGVRCAASADEALGILRCEGSRIAVMMTDQRMPGMKGAELINELRQSFPYVTRILTSAYGELDVALGAVNQGRIYRYEKKPWSAPQLLPVLDDAIARHYRLLAASEALLDSAGHAFDVTRQQRISNLRDALSDPAPHSLGPAPVIGRFLADLGRIQTISPGKAHHRGPSASDLDKSLIHNLRREMSSFASDGQGFELVQGHSLPGEIAQALDILLAASGLTRESLCITTSEKALHIASGQGAQLRMYRHLLSPLTEIPKPLIRQQAALLELYLRADRLNGEIHLTGGRQCFSLVLSIPVTAGAVDTGEPQP